MQKNCIFSVNLLRMSQKYSNFVDHFTHTRATHVRRKQK